jgi:Tol biopolymer transport system component
MSRPWLTVVAPTMLLASVMFGLLPRADARAAFPGANGRIAYAEERVGEPTDVLSVNPDGTQLVNLSPGPASEGQPTWSPDGKTIAFVSRSNVEDSTSQIWTMNADGGDKRPLTDPSINTGQPAWSPSGQSLAFVREESNNFWQIYTMRSDGTNVTPITTGPGDAFSPAWSPDGQQIAFTRISNDTASFDIYRMAPDGTGVTRLTRLPEQEEAPDWSPDGARILFARAVFGFSELHTVNADGTNIVGLGLQGDEPVWSPDGKKIAYRSFDFVGNAQVLNIATADADGSGKHLLNSDLTNSLEYSPDWQPLPDVTAPELHLPADIIVTATSNAGAIVTYNVSATDDQDAAPQVRCTPASGTLFPIGTTGVTCTAIDKAGNRATGTFRVTVRSALPISKDECKNGGWRNFPVFKNQGDCVSFVATGGKNPPAETP